MKLSQIRRKIRAMHEGDNSEFMKFAFFFLDSSIHILELNSYQTEQNIEYTLKKSRFLK
jgi:hypothetical protein